MSPSHPHLSGSSNSIRLLKLLPGFPGQAISCTTQADNLADKPKYFALSYASESQIATHEIILNAKKIRISENLWQFLKRIRSEDYSLVLWCDQLCIDHESEEEKKYLVENTSKVYQSAEETWIWLGPLEQISTTTMTLTSRISKIYDQIALNVDILDKMSPGHWWRSNRATLGDRADFFTAELEFLLNSTNARDYDRDVIGQAAQQCHFFNLWKLASTVTDIYQELYPAGPADALCVHNLIQKLGSRAYWQEPGVSREVLPSRAITIYAGTMSMPYWLFQDLTTYRAPSMLDHESLASEKPTHAGMRAWPTNQIAIMVARYHPNWWASSTLSTRSLIEVENVFNHEVWPVTKENRERIAAAAGLATLKAIRARSGVS